MTDSWLCDPKRMPVGFLKIERSFIASVENTRGMQPSCRELPASGCSWFDGGRRALKLKNR
ncbi:MAG: hypothetical protein M3315_04570 [Actinomycetota bacterium]|nr:hypothetical protein [Actinomycetota bacterium]